MSLLTLDDIGKYLINVGLLDAGGGVKLPAIKHKVADYTIAVATDASGTVFTNKGAAGAVIFTLPAVTLAMSGLYYDFLGAAAQNITIATTTADTLIAPNDLTADSVAASTANQKIGALIRVLCDGVNWFAIPIGVGLGADTTTNTYTVAT